MQALFGLKSKSYSGYAGVCQKVLGTLQTHGWPPKQVIITGASSGLGLAAAKALAARGDWHVVMACRDFSKAARAALAQGLDKENYSIQHLDLAAFDSVRQFVQVWMRRQPCCPPPPCRFCCCNSTCSCMCTCFSPTRLHALARLYQRAPLRADQQWIGVCPGCK